jgi:hypothetical protein
MGVPPQWPPQRPNERPHAFWPSHAPRILAQRMALSHSGPTQALHAGPFNFRHPRQTRCPFPRSGPPRALSTLWPNGEPFPHSGQTKGPPLAFARNAVPNAAPSRIRAAALVQGRIARARAELELSVAGPSGRIWAQRRGPVRFWRNKGPFPLTQQRPLPHSGASKCPSAFGRIEMPLPHSGARKHPFGTLRAGISPSVRKASLREAARATTAPDFALSRLGSRSRPRRPSRQPRN